MTDFENRDETKGVIRLIETLQLYAQTDNGKHAKEALADFEAYFNHCIDTPPLSVDKNARELSNEMGDALNYYRYN